MSQSTLFIGVSDLSILATLTTIVVQLIKRIFNNEIPTQFVTIVVGIVVTAMYTFASTDSALDFFGVVSTILNGCVVSFVAMNGFDALKNIWARFQTTPNDRG